MMQEITDPKRITPFRCAREVGREAWITQFVRLAPEARKELVSCNNPAKITPTP